MTNNHHIIPKSESPYAQLDFPAGIPVTHPIPVGMVDGNLLWDLDIPRTTEEQLLSIAQLAAEYLGVDLPTIVDGIKETQNFGIHHAHVEKLVGEDSSSDELEAFGRAYRVQYILMRSSAILAKVTIDDAIVMYVESKYAIGSMDDIDSPSSETVDLWLPVIVREVKKQSPDIAKILLKDELVPADVAPVMSEEYFDTIADIEIELPIPAYTAYLLCAILQIRLKDSNCGTKKRKVSGGSFPQHTSAPIRHYINMLESAIVQMCPEARWMMERNWHREFDGGGK